MRARCGTRYARMEVAPCLIIYGSVGPGPPGPFITVGEHHDAPD